MASVTFDFEDDGRLAAFMAGIPRALRDMPGGPQIQVTVTDDANADDMRDAIRRAKNDAMAQLSADAQGGTWGDSARRGVNKSQSIMGWELRPPENIREAVGQAIGRASVCWDRPPRGVFQSRDAEGVVCELIDWLYSEWLPTKVSEQLEKRDRAVNEMSMDAGPQESSLDVDVPRHFDAVVTPTMVTVKVGDRTVGTFNGSSRTGRWEIVSTPFIRTPRVKATYPSLVEAISAAMQGGSWEDITDVPIWIQWEIQVDGTRPDEEEEDDLET
jgi:hypothetical protein